MMQQLLQSIKRICSRWVSTATPLLTNLNPGDTIINVSTTNRYRIGDQIMIRDSVNGELSLSVVDVPDTTHIVVSPPIAGSWTVLQGTIIEKTHYRNLIQGIYLGDPSVLPMFPCITINGKSRDSQWLTINSTKQSYQIQISIYVQSDQQQQAYRDMMRIADMVQEGLKRNLYPLVGSFSTTALTADVIGTSNGGVAQIPVASLAAFGGVLYPDLIQLTTNASAGDTFLNIPDNSIYHIGQVIEVQDGNGSQQATIAGTIGLTQVTLIAPLINNYFTINRAQIKRPSVGRPAHAQRIYIEDLFQMRELRADKIDLITNTITAVPCTTVDWLVVNQAKVIIPTRFFYNSWPKNVQYGSIFKGTLVKAARISFFAWEEEIRCLGPFDTSLT